MFWSSHAWSARIGTSIAGTFGRTTPVVDGSSGVAAKAAKRLPSFASRTSSSCETEAPEMTGIGGWESVSKHMGQEPTGARGTRVAAMTEEQSHRDEMNEAIRAQ